MSFLSLHNPTRGTRAGRPIKGIKNHNVSTIVSPILEAVSFTSTENLSKKSFALKSLSLNSLERNSGNTDKSFDTFSTSSLLNTQS